jgi:hypothetical protein
MTSSVVGLYPARAYTSPLMPLFAEAGKDDAGLAAYL